MRSRNRRRKKPGCLKVIGMLLLLGIVAFAGFLLTSVEEKPSQSPVATTHSELKPSHARRAHHKKRHPKPTPAVETTTVAEQVQPEETVPPETPAEKSPEPSKQIEPNLEVAKPEPAHELHTPAIHPGDFSRGDRNSPKIAVTFDAGASAKPTYKILDTLAKHHVRATFFLTGKWIAKNPSLVRRIAAEGCEIGNHTYSHKRLTTLDTGEIAREVEKTETLVVQLTGKSTKPLLRVPFGDRDQRVEEVLASLGYRSIYWDIDSWDSVKKGITSDEIEQRVLGKVRNGSIILMHCGSSESADALDSLLDKLEESGYQQVTISELMQ